MFRLRSTTDLVEAIKVKTFTKPWWFCKRFFIFFSENLNLVYLCTMETQNTNIEDTLIPFTSDYGFKATFGNETDTLFLRKALQALIKSEIQIKEIIFTKSEFQALTQDSRAGLYDMVCTDELGNTFIVEMQSGLFLFFLQRMKFYAFHRFNTMIKQGRYKFDDLKPIYCIGILEKSINKLPDYYNLGVIKNEKGMIMDNQISYITVELDKFKLTEKEVKTDLEKLIFTMKNFTQYNANTQKPQFWTEEWLDNAIKELDTRRFTPEQREQYEMMLAQSAYFVQKEQTIINEARKDERLLTLRNSIINAIKANKLSVEEIAQYMSVSIDFVLNIKEEIENKS
jgi:predicted transposase/invertase (TIGR01784 family)